jgi:hypothetical protein
MPNIQFDSIERFLFDVFLVASFTMTLLKMLAYEWRNLKRLISLRRRP